jgi:hypothetical protein
MPQVGRSVCATGRPVCSPACVGSASSRRVASTARSFNFVADERVLTLLQLGDALLDDNAEHVAACGRTEKRG